MEQALKRTFSRSTINMALLGVLGSLSLDDIKAATNYSKTIVAPQVINDADTITTVDDSAHAVFANQSGVVKILESRVSDNQDAATGVNISTAGEASYGLFADNNGKIDAQNAYGLSIKTTKSASHGVHVEHGGLININVLETGDDNNLEKINADYLLQINTFGLAADGINANNGTVKAYGVNINTKAAKSKDNQTADGVEVSNGGIIDIRDVNINSSGIGINVNNGTVNAKNLSINTNAPLSHGIFANAGIVNAEELSIVANSSTSYGVQAINAGQVVLKNSSITTKGANAYGLFAQSQGKIINNGSLFIETNRSRAHGVYASGEASEILLAGDSPLGVAANIIKTNDRFVYGVYAEDAATIKLIGASSISSGGDVESHGVFADGSGAKIEFSGSAQINANGVNTYSIYSKNGGEINFAGAVDIIAPLQANSSTVSSNKSFGVYSSGENSIVSFVDDLSLKTSGLSSYGIYAGGGGLIKFDAPDDGSSKTTLIDTTTSGDKTIGVVASNIINRGARESKYETLTDNSAEIIFNRAGTLIIKTGGNGSYGILAEGGSSVSNLKGSTIIYGSKDVGEDKIGVYASGKNSTVSLSDTTVETYGMGSSGLVADIGGNISINGFIDINTSGSAPNTDGVSALGADSKVSINSQDNDENKILTGGNGSYGLLALSGGVIEISGGKSTLIDTTSSGDNTVGVIASGHLSKIDFTGQAQIKINTGGEASYGIHASNGAAISLSAHTDINSAFDNNGNETTGHNKIGIYASGFNSTINLSDTSIATSGSNSYGILAEVGGAINITGDTTINSFDSNDDEKIGVGVYALGKYPNTDNESPSRINLLNASISNNAEDYSALKAEGGGKISVSGLLNISNGKTIDNPEGVWENTIGVHALNSGSSISLNEIKIVTNGKNSNALTVDDSGVIAIHGQSVIATKGDAAIGARANNLGSVISFGSDIIRTNATIAKITTEGNNAHGLVVSDGGVVKINGIIEIDTSGDNAIGVLIDDRTAQSKIIKAYDQINDSTDDRAQNRITTRGIASHGLAFINDDSTHEQFIHNTRIDVFGLASNAIDIDPDKPVDGRVINTKIMKSSLFSANGAAVSVTGHESNANLELSNTAPKRIINLDTSSVSSANGFGISVTDNALLALKLNNGSFISAKNGVAVKVTNASLLKLELANSVLNGAIATDSSSHVKVNISDANSRWNIPKAATISALSNAGRINFVDPINSSLTITGDYHGEEGSVLSFNGRVNPSSIRAETELAKPAQTAKLVVQGSTSGSSTIELINLGSANLNPDGSIHLIQVAGKSDAQFKIADGRAVSGGFEYFLLQASSGETGINNGSWFLRTAALQPVLIQPIVAGQQHLGLGLPPAPAGAEVLAVELIAPVAEIADASLPPAPQPKLDVDLINPAAEILDVIAPPPTPTPKPKLDPVLRPENGSYIANQNAANQMFVHSLRDRLAEAAYMSDVSVSGNLSSDLWGRVSSNVGDSEAANGQINISSSSSTLQVGVDLIQKQTNQGLIRGGIMFAAGKSSNKSNAKHNPFRSDGEVEGYAVGVYATWLAARNAKNEGFYLDSWLQYAKYKNQVNGEYLQTEKYASHNMLASVEAGYTFALNNNPDKLWFIEPRAQLIYTNYQQNGFTEHNGTTVKAENYASWTSLFGAQVYAEQNLANGTKLQPFIEVNWLHHTNALSTTLNSAQINSDMPNNRVKAKLGIEASLAKNWNAWVDVGYQQGSHGYRQSSGNIGIKYAW